MVRRRWIVVYGHRSLVFTIPYQKLFPYLCNVISDDRMIEMMMRKEAVDLSIKVGSSWDVNLPLVVNRLEIVLINQILYGI